MKALADKKKAYEAKCRVYFGQFGEAFAKSDKKTFKDNLTPFFGSADACGAYVSEPYPKYEEKAPDKWNEWVKQIYDEGNCSVNALGSKEEATYVTPETVLIDQLQEEVGGQLVEVSKNMGDKVYQLVICETAGGAWVAVHASEKPL